MSNHSYIIAVKRSPVTPRDGALASLSVHDLSAPIIHALLSASNVEASQVDELIVGNALGAGGNPARVIALNSGLPMNVAGLSLDRQCCSGLDAIMLANDMIVSGRASIVIAGGAESYSQRPKRLRKTIIDQQWQEYDQPAFTPWPKRDPNMSAAADALAKKLNISFSQQNAWAVKSHSNAVASSAKMTGEIVAINNTTKDTYTRKLSLSVCERAQRLHGSVSLANTAVAADGAAFCMVVSEAVAKTMSNPKLRICAGATIGADPQLPGLAPVAAINSVLSTTGINASDLVRAEIMEAYAAQALACIEQTHIEKSICNVGGGSLARGHPIGASGAILMTRLFSELMTEDQSGGLGLAAIAAAGGLGTAVLVEHVN